MINSNILNLLNNKEFAERVNQLDNIEALPALFAEYGVDVNQDDVNELCAEIEKQLGNVENNGEINEDELEAVSGGSLVILAGTVAAIGVYHLWKYRR